MMAMDEKSREILQRFADQFRSGAQGAHFEEAEDAQALAFAIDAALSSVQTVKPLEWEESDERWWGAMPIHGLRYEVCVTDRGSVRVRWPESGGWEDFDGDLDVAKAAAQANFEARIRSCLLPTPQPVEKPCGPVASIYEAAKAVARYRGEIAQVEAKLYGRQDYRFYMEPVDATLDEAVQAVEDSARFATRPLPAQGTVAWTMRTLFRAMQEACANYIEPTTYIARFPAESTLRATEFAEPHPLNSDVQKRVMKERRDTAFINDIIRMLDGPEQREAEAFASPPVDSDTLKALQAALGLCDLAATLTGCRGDDDYVNGVREQINAALVSQGICTDDR
jgi:hypothetical protein